jgi:hypothetical protein
MQRLGAGLRSCRKHSWSFTVLLLAVLVRVHFCGFLGVLDSLGRMTVGSMSVVSRLLVASRLVVFGSLAMMPGRVGMMLGCHLVVIRCVVGHLMFSGIF